MKHLALIVAFGLAFAAQADIMLYWGVDVDSNATTGTQTYAEGTLDYAVNDFFSTYSGNDKYLYAQIEARDKAKNVYTVLDTIAVGSTGEVNITGWDSDYDNYIVRLYNSTDMVAYSTSDTYTYQSFIAQDSTYVKDTMGMKADTAQMMQSLQYRAAPEPTSGLLMLLGLAGLALKRKNV